MSNKFVMFLLVALSQSKAIKFQEIELKEGHLSELQSLKITSEKKSFFFKLILNPANLLE